MEYLRLRNLLRHLIVLLKDSVTHTRIPEFCDELGLAVAPEEAAMSKADRLLSALQYTEDSKLPDVADSFLDRYRETISPQERNNLQDMIWPPAPAITKRCRRDISRCVTVEELFCDVRKFDKLLESLFPFKRIVSDLDLYFGLNEGLDKREIERHVYRNPDDWTVEVFFDYLGAFEVTDRRFIYFLEGIASADVQTDAGRQAGFVNLMNTCLSSEGLEFREVGQKDGYPDYRIASLSSASAKSVKNLIFGSSEKPDLRFKDAVSNDIEIVSNAQKVLVYDRPIPVGGLSWRDLLSWWMDTTGNKDEVAAKNSLYLRLRSSLPACSPPQKLFFESYFNVYKTQIPVLPALIPEVWLHWDPQTVHQRGRDALIRSRMDFLLLLPMGVRIVIEIDGKQHYSSDDNLADPRKYAEMVSADRELKLAGYYVFRFGGYELSESKGKELVADFFGKLFQKFQVTC
ncbi:MAG: hypothetical protein R3C53_03690 [Pirellulaceae bacterium]